MPLSALLCSDEADIRDPDRNDLITPRTSTGDRYRPHHIGPLISSGRLTGMQEERAESPKDRFLTVYGRKPVLEVLTDPALDVDKVILADNAQGSIITEIQHAART